MREDIACTLDSRVGWVSQAQPNLRAITLLNNMEGLEVPWSHLKYQLLSRVGNLRKLVTLVAGRIIP
jgi:hypothetical protein